MSAGCVVGKWRSASELRGVTTGVRRVARRTPAGAPKHLPRRKWSARCRQEDDATATATGRAKGECRAQRRRAAPLVPAPSGCPRRVRPGASCRSRHRAMDRQRGARVREEHAGDAGSANGCWKLEPSYGRPQRRTKTPPAYTRPFAASATRAIASSFSSTSGSISSRGT